MVKRWRQRESDSEGINKQRRVVLNRQIVRKYFPVFIDACLFILFPVFGSYLALIGMQAATTHISSFILLIFGAFLTSVPFVRVLNGGQILSNIIKKAVLFLEVFEDEWIVVEIILLFLVIVALILKLSNST